jgi:hypothetical protein
MDVDDALGKRPEHGRVQYTHEASEDHKMNTSVAQHSHKLFFCLRFQACAKLTRWQIRICDRKLSRYLKDRCVQHI